MIKLASILQKLLFQHEIIKRFLNVFNNSRNAIESKELQHEERLQVKVYVLITGGSKILKYVIFVNVNI